MKFLLISLAVVLNLFGAVRANLQRDFEDFIDIIPFDEIDDIVRNRVKNDPQVGRFFRFLRSDSYKKLVNEAKAEPESQELMNFLNKNEFPVFDILRGLDDWVDSMDDGQPGNGDDEKNEDSPGGGLAGLAADLKQLSNKNRPKFKALYEQKKETSPEFAEFVNRLKSQEFKNLVHAVKSNPKVQEVFLAILGHILKE